MYDLMTLAYQADVTRVISFMVSREVSARTYPQVGVYRGPPLRLPSREPGREDRAERRIQTYNVGAFTHFLERLRSTPDGDGSLLDHSLLLYGSNMSNSNAHDHFPLPNVVLGGAERPDARRAAPALPGPHADDEPAAVDARQDGRRPGAARRQHGAAERISSRSQAVGSAVQVHGSRFTCMRTALLAIV